MCHSFHLHLVTPLLVMSALLRPPRVAWFTRALLPSAHRHPCASRIRTPLPILHTRSFAKSSPSSSSSSPSSEPLQTLDDVSFTWTSPRVERPADSVKQARVEAARERARVKLERGRRRAEERRAKLQEQSTLTTDFRGVRDEDNPSIPLLPLLPGLTELERSHLLLSTSPHTASSSQLLSLRTSSLLHRFSKTPSDTGSPEVQVAVLSERIGLLRTHCAVRRGDVHSRRALAVLVERRRKLLKYLRRRNVVSYEMMMKECGVREDEVDGVGRTAQSGNQARRVPRSG